MYSTIRQKFAAAHASGALVFTASTQIPSTSHGLNVVYTLAPALDKKPASEDKDKPSSASTASSSSTSPWLPPDEALLVKKLANHSIVLNKFALTKYHFLLVTNEFQAQTSPLTESDWSAAMETLRTANSESGHRHVGFFNCGPRSGASVAHKHIQFMTLPENFKPFPDAVQRKPANSHFEVAVHNEPRLPFSHFIAFLGSEDPEQVITSYYELLTRTFTELARHDIGRTERSFNVVFTEEWILVVPRSQEKAEGISINSLGAIGLILGKNEAQLETIKSRGFDLVKELGFPNEGTAEFSNDVNSHIQY